MESLISYVHDDTLGANSFLSSALTEGILEHSY